MKSFASQPSIAAVKTRACTSARAKYRPGASRPGWKNNSPGGSRNPRESAVPLGGAGAHHQGPNARRRPGGRWRRGSWLRVAAMAPLKSTGGECQTWNDKRETGATGDATDRFSLRKHNEMEAVQGPATPQPVATVTVHQAPAADALKALAEYGSDSDDDNRVAGGEDFNAGFR